ncbi:MAG: HEPN domain-containing protein [Betaproteobacteria bacterium]
MKPDPHSEARRWLRQAEEDLNDARFVLGGQRYNLACFLAQQAAEKALKGLLYALGAGDVWGHSVAELCRDAASLSADFEPLISQGAVLDKYYIPTRYPDSLPGGIPSEAFEKRDADRALELAEQIIRAVKERV